MSGVRRGATDPIAAGRLWQVSEQLTGAAISIRLTVTMGGD